MSQAFTRLAGVLPAGFLLLLFLVGCNTWEHDQAAGEATSGPLEWIDNKASSGDNPEEALLLEAESHPATRTPFQPVAPTALVLPTATSIPTLVPTLPPEPVQSTNPMPPARGFPAPAPYLSGQVGGEVFNILLLGSDQRGKGAFRTDTILIASIRPRENSISILSIPRDLYVYIPAKGMHKINTAYLWGEVNRYPGQRTHLARGHPPLQPGHFDRPLCAG